MKKINIKTRVEGSPEEVFKRFDKDFFVYLLPKGAELIRFDGSKPGDVVHLRFTFPLNAEWISEIIEEGSLDGGYFFVDQGTTLPFGLKRWLHQHIIRSENGQTVIEDKIKFSTGNALLDLAMYPGLYLAFAQRKGQYQSYFKKHLPS